MSSKRESEFARLERNCFKKLMLDLEYDPTKPLDDDVRIHGIWMATKRAEARFLKNATKADRSRRTRSADPRQRKRTRTETLSSSSDQFESRTQDGAQLSTAPNNGPYRGCTPRRESLTIRVAGEGQPHENLIPAESHPHPQALPPDNLATLSGSELLSTPTLQSCVHISWHTIVLMLRTSTGPMAKLGFGYTSGTGTEDER